MNNKNKIILDLCGGTGSWSKPYRDSGYNVLNITLPDYDVNKVSLSKTFIFFRHQINAGLLSIRKSAIYGILAAPPCTMFSLARTRAKKSRDFYEGMECVESCLNIIWDIRKDNKLAFWALENPMGYLRQFLGKPPFTFDPCDFGHNYTKKTDLWGYYNIPKKKPYKMSEQEKKLCSTNSRKLPSISDITGSKQSDKRSITPNGFAQAFFKANQ